MIQIFVPKLFLFAGLAFGGMTLACEIYQDADERPQFATAEAFYESEEAEQTIDLDTIDYLLLSEAIFHETNLRREEQGLNPLEHLPELEEASCLHARDMVEEGFFSHLNPHDEEREMPHDRVALVGLEPRFVAENISQAFGIRYEAGEPVFPDEENGEVVFRREPGGAPIEAHSYRSFAVQLLDDWMDSPEHRENILAEEPSFLGAACEYTQDEQGMDMFYCVQLFFDRF